MHSLFALEFPCFFLLISKFGQRHEFERKISVFCICKFVQNEILIMGIHLHAKHCLVLIA